MPTYEYECMNCGQKVEIFQKTLEIKKVLCSHCGSDKLVKQWSVPGFIKSNDTNSEEMPCGHGIDSCDMPDCPAKRGRACGNHGL